MKDLKQLAEKVEGKLTSKDGFKAIHGGGLFGGKAKKSFEVWSAAEKKAVLPLHLVHHFVNRDDDSMYHYGIYAFSTKGEIDAETLNRLKEAASQIDLGTVRYECLGYTRLQLWRGETGSFAHENNTITEGLSDLPDGLFVYAESIGSDEDYPKLEKPLVIYAHLNQQDYIYPITKITLSKI